MNTTSLRRAIAPGVAAIALAASLAACGGSDDNSASDGSSPGAGTSGAATGLSGKVAAGGSSAQEKAQEAWRAGFGQDNPDVTISYDAVGSGTGRENFISGAYAFAGTDSPLDSDELASAKKTCGADPIQVPAYISPIDVIFNLQGVDSLNLDAPTIAKIFNGTIKKWDDPAIKKLNPSANLPSSAISPVHRSDSSGTTDNFTDYLHAASKGAWKDEHSSDWPNQSGESAEGTSGVIGAVQGGQGTIGYADDSGVKGTDLGVVHIKVGSQFVAPSPDGAAAGLSASTLASGTPASVMEYQINRTTTDPSTYPLFLASYLVACPTYSDKSTSSIVKGFLTYAVSDTGQKAAAANAYSAPLPSDISEKATQLISAIS